MTDEEDVFEPWDGPVLLTRVAQALESLRLAYEGQQPGLYAAAINVITGFATSAVYRIDALGVQLVAAEVRRLGHELGGSAPPHEQILVAGIGDGRVSVRTEPTTLEGISWTGLTQDAIEKLWRLEAGSSFGEIRDAFPPGADT